MNEDLIDAALILEGGSLRCLYTAGILDFFMMNNIFFKFVVGVSAGALTGANYISKQIGRTARINIMHSNDKKYYGYRQLFINRNAYNFNYLLNNPINELYPYDIETYNNSKQIFLIGVTNCENCQIEYLKCTGYDQLSQGLKASCSLPILFQPIKINDKLYIDGGVSYPLDYEIALKNNYKKIIIIRTRERDFIKKGNDKFIELLLKRNFINKKLFNTIKNHHNIYNEKSKLIEKLHSQKKIFSINPSKIINIKRFERSFKNLINLYKSE